MKTQSPAKVPLWIWPAVVASIVFTVWLTSSYHRKYKQTITRQRRLKSLATKRLEQTNSQSGVVIIGTSLAKCSLPYDDDLDRLSKEEYNFTIKSTRMTLNGGQPDEFNHILADILQHKPRWVFLQAELFFIEFIDETPFQLLRSSSNNVKFARQQSWLTVKSLFTGDKAELPPYEGQNDIRLKLNKTVLKGEIAEAKILINKPEFSKKVELFIQCAKAADIQVILLEINRSKPANQQLGKAFRAKLDTTLQQVAKRYNIPLWKFAEPIPLSHYSDRAHLNYRGRAVFTHWFLKKLSSEKTYD